MLVFIHWENILFYSCIRISILESNDGWVTWSTVLVISVVKNGLSSFSDFNFAGLKYVHIYFFQKASLQSSGKIII